MADELPELPELSELLEPHLPTLSEAQGGFVVTCSCGWTSRASEFTYDARRSHRDHVAKLLTAHRPWPGLPREPSPEEVQGGPVFYEDVVPRPESGYLVVRNHPEPGDVQVWELNATATTPVPDLSADEVMDVLRALLRQGAVRAVRDGDNPFSRFVGEARWPIELTDEQMAILARAAGAPEAPAPDPAATPVACPCPCHRSRGLVVHSSCWIRHDHEGEEGTDR